MSNIKSDAQILIEKSLQTKDPVLDLGNCGLTDDSPEMKMLEDCRHLKVLSLGEGFFSGGEFKYTNNNGSRNIISRIPDNLPHSLEFLSFYKLSISKIENLSRLINLQSLEISYNGIIMIEGLESLSKLHTLYLQKNQISKIEGLENLSNLQSLDIQHNQISKIEGLENLSNLQSLYLGDNQISKIEGLENLSNLLSLYLGQNQISKIEGLENLSNLQSLDIRINQISKIEGLENLSNLLSLYLGQNQISKIEGLENLSNLLSLYLHENQISKIEGLENLGKLQLLYLGKNQISKIEGLENLGKLELLNLEENQISEIEGLENLDYLQYLNLNYNQISKIEGFKNLGKLETLNLDSNQISKIEGLDTLVKLSFLFLNENKILKIEGLTAMAELEFLTLSHNQIGKVEGLDTLSNLTHLYLRHNQIGKVEGLDTLKSLSSLNLDSNQITKIENIDKLTRLEKLSIADNKIAELSPSFLESNKLPFIFTDSYFEVGINLLNNPLELPPADVLKQGKEFAIDYLKNRDKIPLNECKVILVGRGSVGKTSLQKRIFNDSDFNRGEKETHGIRKECWADGVKAADGKPIKVHFWDFGGQHIQQTLHQFFYTENTIYILVLDKRKDESPEDFLELIKGYSANSPVIVVYNNEKKNIDDPVVVEYDINPSLDSTLQNKYPNIRKVIGLCCGQENDKGVATLRNYLQQFIPSLDHVKEPYPPEWLNVKELLLEEVRNNYITFDHYETLCNENKVARPEIQKGLAKMLNNVGTITFFDRKFVGKYFILNPDWLTSGAYQIILSPITTERKGRIRYSDLDLIFKNCALMYEYRQDEYEFLLQLMKEFDLCHEFSKDEWLIPSSLEGQPKTNLIEYRKSAYTLYSFEYPVSLPASVIHRFIARNIRYAHQNDYWKNGIVVKHPDSDTLIFVEADVKDKGIRLWIRGEKIRECWEFFRKDFREFSEKFEYQETVYIDYDKGVKVSYSDLLDLEKNGEREWFLPKHGKINVKETLGLFESPLKEKDGADIIAAQLREPYTHTERIAISYSHSDIEYCKVLKNTWLKPLEREGKISIWFDQEIIAGSVWEQEIEQKLNVADIIILLISQDFFASDYIEQKELPLIKSLHDRRKAKVLPIIVRNCDWESSEWSSIQATPVNANTGKLEPVVNWTTPPDDADAAWLVVKKQIHALLKR